MAESLNLTKRVWDDVQRIVNDWQKVTFPKSTPQSVLKHLKKEVRELARAVRDGKGEGEESADCILLLMALCGKRGLSLYDEVEKKFAVNLKRKWGKPNKQGFQEHVRRGK